METGGRWRCSLALALCLLTTYARAADHTSETMGSITFSCPDGWEIKAPDCYLFVDFEMPFEKASDMCGTYGASLVHIEDEVEAKDVGHMVQQHNNKWKHYWIGNMVNGTEDVCTGLWDRDEPKKESGVICVAANAPQGRWASMEPDTRLPSVCKTPACVQGTFRCRDGSKCISDMWKCDGDYDCDDQSDEDNCDSHCTHYMHQESGTLDENSGYTAGQTCTWIIEGTIGKPLSVTFSTVNVEQDVDYIEVWSGGPSLETSKHQDTLTGQMANKRVLGTNHFLIIRLVPDLTNQLTGFQATWGPDDELSPVVREIEVTDAGVEITSPYYMTQPPDVFLRQFTVYSDDGSHITMEVLENGFRPGFRYDPMTLSNVNSFDIFPDSYVSIEDKFSFSVMSDGTPRDGTGEFKAILRKGCSVDFTRASGIIVPPNYDNNNYYPALLTCTYIVRAPQNEMRNFEIRFPVFELADDKDFVKVYNGADNSSPELSPTDGYTVDNPPTTFLSPGPVFMVEFFSSRVQTNGFFFISFFLDCPAIGNTDNMQLSTTATSFETEVTISCNPGYSFAQEEFDNLESVTVKCSMDGKWNVSRLPTCQVIYCGIPGSIANGFITAGSGAATYGHNVTYQCFEGFQMTSSPVSTCGEGSMWSQPPTCSASTCTAAQNPAQGSFTTEEGEGQDFGTVIRYSCDSGYDLVGSRYSLCQSNGTWSHDMPVCEPIKCPLPEVDRATLSSSEPVVLGDMLTVTCNGGFEINGQQTAQFPCRDSGSFDVERDACQDVDECSTLDPCTGSNQQCENTNGSYVCLCEDGYRFENNVCDEINECADGTANCDDENGGCNGCIDQPCTFQCKCNTGYTLYTANGTEGKFIPAPEDGMRFRDIYYIDHTCVPKKCDRPTGVSAPLRLMSEKDMFFFGESVEYMCDFGFTLVGDRFSTCAQDGQWHSSIPTCNAVTCDRLNPTGLVLNVYPNATTNLGDTVMLECESQTGPAYNKTLYCAYDRETDSFRLQGDAPHCPAIDCGAPPRGGGESYTQPSSTGLGAAFTFSCIGGFQKMGMSVNGGDVVECQRNGRWGLGNLTCEGGRCTDPGTPGGMEQVSANFEVDGLVEYSCTRDGYEPSSRFLKCEYDQGTGTAGWNSTLPTCEDVASPSFTNCPSSTVYLNLYDQADSNMTTPVAEDNSGLVLPLVVEPVGFRLDVALSQSVNVTYTARDAAGNSAVCQIQIVVNDPSALPSLDCPDYLILNVTNMQPYTYDLNMAVTADDGAAIAFAPSPSVVVSPDLVGQAPSAFRVTATNRFGFQRQCAFLVEVRASACLATFIERDIVSKNAAAQCQTTMSGGLDCTVTCNTNHAYQDGQTTKTYECTGENVWSPALPARSCVEFEASQYRYEVTVEYTLTGQVQITTCQDALTAALEASVPTKNVPVCLDSDSSPLNFNVAGVVYSEIQPQKMKAQITLAVTSDTSTISENLFEGCKVNLRSKQLTGSLFEVPAGTCGGGTSVTNGGHDTTTTGDYSCDQGRVLQDVGSNKRCVPCEPGYQFSNDACVGCANGQYQDLAGQLICKECENGADFSREPRLASTQCVASCPAGFYNGQGKVEDPNPCVACPEDSYLSSADPYFSTCRLCGSSETTYGFEGADDASQCFDKCRRGEYPVSNTASAASDRCAFCPTGFYKTSEGNTACEECGFNETTTVPLATSADNCVPIPTTPTCNNGNVVARDHRNVCDCLEGYYGDTCENMVNRCDANPCYNGGTCTANGHDSYTCLCPFDEQCEMVPADIPYNSDTDKQLDYSFGVDEETCKQKCIDHDDCYSAVHFTNLDQCSLHTESNTGPPPKDADTTAFIKSCSRTYFFNGTDCENDLTNDCTSETCAELEFCRDKVNGADCVCPSSNKYVEPRCEQDLTLCEPNPCENNGVCEDSGAGVRYTCVCPAGYTGEKCETNIDDCEENPDGCLYGQQCVDGVDAYTCQCVSYGGEHCQEPADFCGVTGTCDNGLCYNDYNTSMAVCVCEHPYRVGSNGQCEEIDICGEEMPCENNSTCQRVSPGQYECMCPTGYTGFHCQHDIDDCSPNPCENGGTCTDGLDSYSCDCVLGFSGNRCENLINMCPGMCNMTGTNTTVPVTNDCKCMCKAGFTGQYCEDDIDECLSLPCMHGGTCTNSDTPNEYTCACKDGWTGKNCEELPDFCSTDTCDNTGTCLSLQNDFFCQCESGTYGRTCQTTTDLCSVLSPCAATGTCQAGGGTAECVCSTSYAGDSCHLIEDGCSVSPCSNGGSCVTNAVGFSCDCDEPYSGETCETKASACDSVVCPSSSTCVEMGGDTMCMCGPGKIQSGSICKEMENNFDIYLAKAGDPIMSYQLFRLGSSELTLAFWVAPLNEPDDKPLQIRLSNDISILAVGADSVFFGDEAGVRLTDQNDQEEDFNPGQWNLFAVTWESSGSYKLYLNSLALKGGMTGATFPASDELLSVYIGASMAGYFSQLSVWNRVLDYTEILQQVFQDPLNVPQSGIVLAWSGYEPNLWTRVITPSTVSPGRTMCEGGKSGDACATTSDKMPPVVTDVCPSDDIDQETSRLVQATTLADPNLLFTDGGAAMSNIDGTLLTFGAHRIVYASMDDSGNVATCRFNAYVRRPGQSCSNKKGLDEANLEECGSSGALTVKCPGNKVPLFAPKKLTCGKLGSFNLGNQYRLPPGLLCGAPSAIVYQAKLTLKYELLINCLGSHEPDVRSNLQAKVVILREDWMGLCADSACPNADISAKCDGSASRFVTATIILPVLPARLMRLSDGVNLTAHELLETAAYELDSFQISSVAGAVLQKNLIVITLTPSCEDGFGLLGDTCVECVAGSYLNETTVTCMECEVGTYTDTDRQTACTPCPDGQTTKQPGATSCIVECAEGRYSDLNEDPPTCKDCPKNFYQPLKGQVTCLPCLAGKVSENPGTVSGDECFDTCPAGEQLVESVCVKCPRGTYRDGIDMEVCEDCRDGLTTPGEGATSENQCQQTACPPGQMRNATSNQCMDCDYGFYQPDKWEDSCLPCNESYTTENQGSVNASQCRFVCPAGKEDVGGESCQPCQKGYYRTDSLEDRFKMCTKCNDSFTTENTMSTSSDDCRIRICLAGYKRNVADNLCYPCPPGEYQPDDLQTECIACPRNLTTDGEGKDNVTQCVFYCAAGYEVLSPVNETCSPCARGKFKTNDGDAKFQACQDCTTGTTTDDMASVSDDFCNVTACTAGQVVDGSTCRDCEVDTYQSLNLPTSSTGCEPCQPGFGTNFSGQTSSDACLRVCPPGQQVNLTLDECVTCPQGTYNTGNQIDRFSPCQSCVDGYVTVSDGATHPDNCTLRDCPAGQYIDVNDDCQPCPVGQYQNTPRLTSCEDCPTNRNTSGTGADEVTDCTISCPAGEEQKDPDSLQDTCAPCDDDEYKPVFGPGTCFPCTGNVTSSASDRVACTVQFCDVGFTQDGSECVACEVGTYKDMRGNGDCTACPTNTTTAGPASTSRDDCSEVFCDLGLYASGGTEPCLSCPLGTYKNESGNQECTPCPTGFTTAGKGSTDGADCSLVVCPAGKYRTTANQCENCGFGKYQPDAGETVCKSCDPGFSTDTETSTLGSECKILCDAGSYRASDTECELCAVGSYQTQNQSTATSCMNCDDGFTTANNGSTAASDCYKICLAGQYLPMTSQDTCEPCPLGMYQSMNGSRSCDSCGTDFTTLSTGSDDQLDCQPICTIGEYLNTTQRSCVKCPLGTYNPVAASLDTSIFECESCPEKKTTPVTGAIDATYCNVTDCDRGEKRTAASGGCELCEKGTYQPQKSQSSCFDCPGEKTTLLPGRIFVNACVDVCGDGEEWDVVNQTCVDCPLDYYRKAQSNDTQSCIKCPEGRTTVSTKASACTPKATGGDPTPVQRRTVRIRIRIKIKFCTNIEQMGNAITQFVFNILIRADQRFATLCQGACTNVKITFMAGCLRFFQRQRRQAEDNKIQEVEIAVEDVPIEMNGVLENGVPVTQRTEEVVARAFENYQQEQTLLDNNQLEFGDVESIVSVPSCQPGQRTVGDSCEDCAAGTYSIDGAGTSCTPCPMNQYQNESGQTSCQACPEKMYTSGQGSNSSTDCRKRCDEANARQQYCSGHGDCVYDAFTDNGVRCECDDMYTGPTCAIRESPDDQDKMALIGGIVGGVAAFLLILLLIFGIVAAMRRSAKREEKKAKDRDPDQMSEMLYNPSYHYSMYDNSPERPIGGRPAPAIMYMNPAADQDVREFYQSERDSVRASRKRSQSYEGAWQDLPSLW